MYRDKTIIRCRKTKEKMRFPWIIRIGKSSIPKRGLGIYKLFTVICHHLADTKYIYSIDIVIKRRK